MAEFAVGTMLNLARSIPQAFKLQQDRKLCWDERWTKFQGLELRGLTVGIFGYGAIGEEVARLCKSFGNENDRCAEDEETDG